MTRTTELGLREIHSNAFLAAVFLSQTAGFRIWSVYGRWRYRIADMFVIQAVLIASVAALWG